MDVSVVIPAHNAAKTLAKTLESLLAQTHPDWEAIVVDDGSSDETVTITARFAERDPRIRAVSQPQSGVSTALNKGIGKSPVDTPGGFDPTLRTCEDWDLWQRTARAGARFGCVRKVLAYYRARPGSTSTEGRQLLKDGLRVITRGHTVDPRIPIPHPAYTVLAALQGQLPAFRLALRTRLALECLLLKHTAASRPLTVETAHAIRVEVTEPIPDVSPPARCERSHICRCHISNMLLPA